MEEINEEFKKLEKMISTFKSEITSLNSQLKLVEKKVKKEFKKQIKQSQPKSKSKKSKAPSGFSKPAKVSEKLTSFMKLDKDTLVARTEATKYIIDYIKTNGLSESINIKPDETLLNLLEISEDEKLTFFNIQKYMNKHYI